MLTEIFVHTPVWVWALLAALLVLGYSQTRERRAGLARVALLPLAMIAWSLQGLLSGFAQGGNAPMLFGAWLAGLGLSAALLQAAPQRATYDAARKTFLLPGSWAPLMVIILIFIAHYAAAVTMAIAPRIGASVTFKLSVAAVYGLLSGYFAGRALSLVRLARRAGPVSA